jgi:hypothetical protein
LFLQWINAELAVVEQKHKMDVKLCKSARSRAIHSAADLATLAKLESVLAAAKTAALVGKPHDFSYLTCVGKLCATICLL